MKDFKNELKNICDDTLLCTDKYTSLLSNSRNKDIKKVTAEYYAFTTDILRAINRLDALTAKTVEQIRQADEQNSFTNVSEYSKQFECCLEYRKSIEKYLTDTQDTLKKNKDDISSAVYSLKACTDLFTRKTIMLKNSLQKTYKSIFEEKIIIDKS